MTNIAIITDTDSSLPADLARNFAIQQVPITIHFGEESYTCGVDIDDAQVFERIDQKGKLPTTAAPSPSAFTAAYQRAFESGATAIVCICVSSKVSSTYNSAVTACEMFPDKDITVIDSLTMSMAQGFMVLTAARAAQAGATPAEISAAVEDTRKRMHVYALLPTLKYVAMSGRVGKLAAGLADTLEIKPILTVSDGKLALLERIRTHHKAIQRLLELIETSVEGKRIESAAMIHVNNLDGVHALQDQFCARSGYDGEILLADFTPGLSVHAGPGVVGMVILEEA